MLMSITCFLSHSWRDGEHDFAIELADALQSHAIGKAWIDERDIPGGGHVMEHVVAGVSGCDVFLFIMSPNSLSSKWCRLELKEALKQRADSGIQTIPLLLKTCTLPQELVGLLYIDFRDASRFEIALNKLLGSIKKTYFVRATVLQLLSGDEMERVAAAQILSLLKNQFTVPVLAKRLAFDSDPTVRYWLGKALGRIGSKEACVALLNALAHEANAFAMEGIKEGLRAAGCQYMMNSPKCF